MQQVPQVVMFVHVLCTWCCQRVRMSELVKSEGNITISGTMSLNIVKVVTIKKGVKIKTSSF